MTREQLAHILRAACRIVDDDHHKSDMIDAMIVEESQFHQTFAYYGQGVSIGTAVLGPGWQSRLVRFDDPASAPAEARCLDPHDLVLAKLAAHREKDLDFCWELAQAGLVDLSVLRGLLSDPPVSVALAERDDGPVDSRGREAGNRRTLLA